MVEIKKRLRASYIGFAICLVAAIASFAYDLWLKHEEERNLTPVLALGTMVKGLKNYYDQHRSFPKGFDQLDNRIWRRPRLYYGDGSEMFMAHYHYSYYFANPYFNTIWAFPRGERKAKAYTVYLELTPRGYQTWRRRKPLSDEQALTVPPVPSKEFLRSLEMTEGRFILFKDKPDRNESIPTPAIPLFTDWPSPAREQL